MLSLYELMVIAQQSYDVDMIINNDIIINVEIFVPTNRGMSYEEFLNSDEDVYIILVDDE